MSDKLFDHDLDALPPLGRTGPSSIEIRRREEKSFRSIPLLVGLDGVPAEALIHGTPISRQVTPGWCLVSAQMGALGSVEERYLVLPGEHVIVECGSNDPIRRKFAAGKGMLIGLLGPLLGLLVLEVAAWFPEFRAEHEAFVYGISRCIIVVAFLIALGLLRRMQGGERPELAILLTRVE